MKELLTLTMKITTLLTLWLTLLLHTVSHAQATKPNFVNAHDEIRYYLTEEGYTDINGCVVTRDNAAIARIKYLAREYESLFIAETKAQLGGANKDKTDHVIWILLQVSDVDYRPLKKIFLPNSFEKEFANAQAIQSALAQSLSIQWQEPQSVYAAEVIGILKYQPAVPNTVSFLNYEGNLDRQITLIALANLHATNELTEYIQQKVFEDLCIKQMHNVGYGVETNLVLKNIQELAATHDPKLGSYFSGILQKIIFKPSESALSKLAIEAKAERLRGLAVLLLSHYPTQTALQVVLDRLEKDASNLVRFWAAQSFITNPNLMAVDALLAVYQETKDNELRFGCIEALGVIGGEKAIKTLEEALSDESQLVRDTAKFRLSQLRARAAEKNR